MRTDEAQADYEKELDEKADYEAQLEAEVYAEQAMQEAEWEAQMQHAEEVKNNPLRIIVSAIIEQQEQGQLSLQTMKDLKMLLNADKVAKEL